MRALRWIALAALAALAGSASAAPDGVPARIHTIGNWRSHDPVEPLPGAVPWTPSDVVGFLTLFPEAVMDLGYRDGYPAGSGPWHAKGTHVDEAQALAAARGVDVANRLCVTERPDTLTPHLPAHVFCHPSSGGGGCDFEGDMDGRYGEAETVVKAVGTASAGNATVLEDAAAIWPPQRWRRRLLVLRPGSAGEERRRVIANDATRIEVDAPWLAPPQLGDAYQVRGSFDPAWILRVPRSVHEESVRRFWSEARDVCGPEPACAPPAEPLDPFDPANRRGVQDGIDAAAIRALATPASVPALYGAVHDAGSSPRFWEDPYFETTALLLDVRNPRYREWRLRYLMYKLEDYKLAPGEAACVMVTYKPGWHTWWDEAVNGPGTSECSVPGTHMWTGPAHVCPEGSSPGGPFNPTPFGPGEFEAAVSAYFREMFPLLARHGWADVEVFTAEAPALPGPNQSRWTILADDVRRLPQMTGRWEGSLEPALAELQSLQSGSAPPPDPGAGSSNDGGASDPPRPRPPDSSGAGTVPTAPAGHVSKSTGGGSGGLIEPPPHD